MAAIDSFSTLATTLNAPANDGFVITPHDTNELSEVTRAIYVGGSGNVVVQTNGGTTLTFYGCVAGQVLPVRAKKVTTATTATNLIALV